MRYICLAIILLLLLIANDCICNIFPLIEGNTSDGCDESCLLSGYCDSEDCATKRMCLQRDIICDNIDNTNSTEDNSCNIINEYKKSANDWNENIQITCNSKRDKNCFDKKYGGILKKFCSQTVDNYLKCSHVNNYESQLSGENGDPNTTWEKNNNLGTKMFNDDYDIWEFMGPNCPRGPEI
jgi:hypothetical protein